MKHQYFGDVKDYLKYGLLREVTRSELKLGVCWMLTPDDTSSDGRKTGYLSAPSTWRRHDPDLYDLLRHAVLTEGLRNLSVIETALKAEFVTSYVPPDRLHRTDWLARDVLTKDCQLWFFDPGNGIEVPSAPNGRTRSQKHVYWDEVEAVWATGASLLIFQHFARKNHEDHVASLAQEIDKRLAFAEVHALWTAEVVFLLVSQPAHRAALAEVRHRVALQWSPRIVERMVAVSKIASSEQLIRERPKRFWGNRIAAAIRAMFAN